MFGFVDGLFLPAVGAAPAFVTTQEGQTRLQALRTVVYRGAPMVGAPLASALLVSYGTAAAFAVAAFLFAASVVALSLTRMTRPDSGLPLAATVEDGSGPPPGPSVLGEIRDGLRLIVSDRRLLVVVDRPRDPRLRVRRTDHGRRPAPRRPSRAGGPAGSAGSSAASASVRSSPPPCSPGDARPWARGSWPPSGSP